MSNWKTEAVKRYKEECFKQTKPYQFEIAYNNMRGELPKEGNSPLSAKGTIILFPDEDANILNFEGINTEYLIFVNRNGLPEKDFVTRLLQEGEGADLIYCDEDFISNRAANLDDINEKVRVLRTPWRKPDYSPDTLLSFPYIETCFAIRTAFARTVPAIKKQAEISDNVRVWDFLLRATELTNKITHVREILFHRDLKTYVIKDGDEAIKDTEIYAALVDIYNKPGYKLCREAAERRRGLKDAAWEETADPVVSIIIPSKDNPEMVKECIRNIRIHSGSIKYEIIVVDNGSNHVNKARVEKLIENLPKGLASYVYDKFDFNFSKMCNIGAYRAAGSFLLFLNDDVDACSDRFLEKLLKYAAQPYVGAVGAKLLYPDGGRIQHIGVTNIRKGPTHKLISLPDADIQYYGRNCFAWDVLAVTGACLMIDREKYFQVGGFSDKMRVGYNDIDLCVKLVENGYFNVINNECVLTHKESVSRGHDHESGGKMARLKEERNMFYQEHPWLTTNVDPFYNPYLDMDTIEYKSYIVADYQITDYRNKVTSLAKLPVRPSGKVSFTIDRTYIEWGIGGNASDAFVFDGWGLIDKKDNALYKKFMVFVPLDDDGNMVGDCLVANVSSKYRSDIKEVFPEAENVCLAGFECKVPVSLMEVGTRYRIGVCLKKKGGLKTAKLTLGDIYEPGRGIVKEN